jgi:hypothetical protein
MKTLVSLVAIAALALAACGDEESNNDANGNSNNTAANNTAANNTTANNTTPNSSTNAGNSGNAPVCDPDFSEANACGGDPVGTWNVAGACVGDVEVPECPAAVVTVETRDVSGTLVVTDANWTYDVSGTIVYSANIPTVCVAAVGGDCAAVATALEAECSDPGDGSCDCTAEEAVEIASSGGYTLEDGNRAVIDNGDEWIFCIEGDGITLRDSNAADSATYVGSR